MLLSPIFMCTIYSTNKVRVVEMKKIKETPSGLLAFGVLVAVALFIYLANKSVIGFVCLSLLVLLVTYLFWFVLTMIIDDLRGR